MQALMVRFGLAALVLQIVELAAVWWSSGNLWICATVCAITSGMFVIYCVRLLQPLTALQGIVNRSVHSGSNPASINSLFSQVSQQLESLEQLAERQSVQLAEYKERFDAVLSGMVEGVIAIDEAGLVLFLNRAAREILSIDVVDVIGKPLIGLVRYEAVLNATREALETHRIVDANFQTYQRFRRNVRLRVAPMAGDPLPGMTLVFHDVTDLARLETIRRDFVANVSHELKTPLSSIKANAETLLLGAIDKAPDNRRFVEQIERQAETLNQQILDLLQLARIESGRQAFSSEPLDLVSICEEVLQRHAMEAERKQVQLSLENLADDNQDCLVWADREALGTIMDNLVSNALRYSHHHGLGRRVAQVKLEIKSFDRKAVVEVIDNGIGIAPEHQSRIFERFFRVDPARSRELGGTGLGLAIVKHLVLSFDGQVEVQSKLGVGSTFRVTFPRVIAMADLEDSSRAMR
jgi:two-component system phosphate regulon sensor histidine kinase PhoR